MSIAIENISGMSRLIRDYFSDYDKVADYYNGDYRDQSSFFKQAGHVRKRSLPLERVTEILAEQNQIYGCGHQTITKIGLLKEKACAVVTGQQTGLFGGPLFTVYKALTAIKLAERLSRTCDDCFVPVFWLASDDHDFREVNHCIIANKNNEPTRITYDGHPEDSHQPVSDIILNDSINEVLLALDENTHPSEFKADVLESLAASWQSGRSLPTSFATWLMQLFKSFGLIIIDGSDPRLKKLADDLFSQEIEQNSPSSTQAMATSAKLEKAGYHSQVKVGEGFFNLFMIDGDRQSLQYSENSYFLKHSGTEYTAQQMSGLLRDKPEVFSPNVLLRPLYQDCLLPTVTYIAGPAETAYYGQMKGIYAAFDIPMPIIYPRKSVTLLESRIDKVLQKYGLNVPELWGDAEKLITAITRDNVPEDLEKDLSDTTSAMLARFEEFERKVVAIDKSLTDTAKNVKMRINGQMDMLDKKIMQAYKKNDGVMRQQIYKAHNSIYPDSKMQEREYNIVPYLFKHGFGFIDRLYEAIDISDFGHQIVRI